MAGDRGSAEPGMGPLRNPSPRAAHYAVQEATQLSAAAGESSAADYGQVMDFVIFSRYTIFV